MGFGRNRNADAQPAKEQGGAEGAEQENPKKGGESPGEAETAAGDDRSSLESGANGAAGEADPSQSVDQDFVRQLESEVKENYDKYLRAVAELENFKKRAVKERADVLRYAGEHLARDLLEVADHLHLALSQEVTGANEDLLKGVRMISDRLLSILEQHSIRREGGVGKPFDPNKQEALASVPTSDHPPGTVIEEYRPAYYFKDKLLRPGQVVVAAEPTEGKE